MPLDLFSQYNCTFIDQNSQVVFVKKLEKKQIYGRKFAFFCPFFQVKTLLNVKAPSNAKLVNQIYTKRGVVKGLGLDKYFSAGF